MYQGRILDFKLGGTHLKKKNSRQKGGPNIFGVFRVKNLDPPLVPGQRIFSHFLVQISRADAEIVTNKLLLDFFISMLFLYFNVQLIYQSGIFTDHYLKSKRQHFRVFVYKSNLYFFFHRKLQNFEFKNYLHHYLKRSVKRTGACGQDTASPFLHPTPLFSFFFFFHFHGLEICKTAIMCCFLIA
jgi:hypothetical protein